MSPLKARAIQQRSRQDTKLTLVITSIFGFAIIWWLQVLINEASKIAEIARRM